jgi:CheY-like chemotaxis protein
MLLHSEENNSNNVINPDGGHIPPGLPPPDISRIQESFQAMAPQGMRIVSRFHDLLFEKYPDLQPLFHSSILSQQRAKFLNELRTLVLYLESPQVLREILVQLGKRHAKYGIEIRHYPPVLATFLDVLAESGGDAMDGKTYEAWAHFLHLIRAIMLEKYSSKISVAHRDEQSHNHMISDRPKRVLLIDDDHQILDLYQSYLELQGYVCSQVSDVSWAFTHLQLSRYDLVLTDFQMPVMNGIQIRKNLSRLGMAWCPPFVLVTGSLNQEIRKQALRAGFVAVLKKPHDLPELDSIIQMALPKSLEYPRNQGLCENG